MIILFLINQIPVFLDNFMSNTIIVYSQLVKCTRACKIKREYIQKNELKRCSSEIFFEKQDQAASVNK